MRKTFSWSDILWGKIIGLFYIQVESRVNICLILKIRRQSEVICELKLPLGRRGRMQSPWRELG